MSNVFFIFCGNIKRHLREGYYSIIDHYRKRYGFEITCKNIVVGLKLIHPWAITVDANAIIGNNVTLFKGCAIGEIREGAKKGNYP